MIAFKPPVFIEDKPATKPEPVLTGEAKAVQEARKARDDANQREYLQLVVRLHTSGDVPPEETITILDKVGLDETRLQNDLLSYGEYLSNKQTVAGEAEATAKESKLHARFKDTQAGIEAAQQTVKKAIAQHQEARDKVNNHTRLMRMIGEARRKLNQPDQQRWEGIESE